MNNPLLSILIPTIDGRESQYESLRDSLIKQYDGDEVQICVKKDNREMSIGAKRNNLLNMASGEYLCFIDDDDDVSENYIQLLLKAIKIDCDCASLKGVITYDGLNPQIFEHSLRYSEWKTVMDGDKVLIHERYPNHLNMIKSSIAKQFQFPENNFGEDHHWSKQIHESGLLKKEYYIEDILYYYNFKPNK